jgi:teichuronic acid biosynthesis glycosyltransferase TuaH
MTKGSFDIIILALSRWDGLYSSTAYSLARELSRHTRVFYIDNPFTYKDYFLHRTSPQLRKRNTALLRGKDAVVVPDADYPDLIAATPQLVYPVNWLPPGRIYNWLARSNDAIVHRVIKKLQTEFNVKKFVFVNAFNPLYGRFFPGSFRPALSIYYCVDDIKNSDYISRHGSYLEGEAMQKADITLVTSMELKRIKSHESTSVYYLPNAADVDLFRQAMRDDIDRPAELLNIKQGRRVVFYMGNICQRIDYELLFKIARQPDLSLVMVGPTTYDTYRKVGLDRMNNVIFTGRKNLDELPAYLKYADCCIIPFLCTPLTKSIYPLKINEYLSAGKPVVSTDFSPDIANFGDVAFISRSHDEFINNISLAISTDSREKQMQRIGYAAGNNWKARATEFMDLISKNVS